ncbi:hypothetical protein BUE80_DR005555 [Diplocarpon rosae]|nr:hypothetical protein BUE80_DR005555 [Diplocarpon rosae]
MAIGPASAQVSNTCSPAPEWCGSDVEAQNSGRTTGWGCKVDGDRPCDTDCLANGSRGSGENKEFMLCCKPCPSNSG